MAGREQLPVLDEDSFAVPSYSLVKPLSMYPFISWGHTQHSLCYEYCFAKNVRPLEINCAFASETVLCNVLPTSALHIAAICLGLCFVSGGGSVDWDTSVNIIWQFLLKPWWEQYWTKAVLIPALIVHSFPRLLPCEIEIQHILYGESTHKHIPVVSFSWSAMRSVLKVGQGKGQKECPAKTMTVLESLTFGSRMFIIVIMILGSTVRGKEKLIDKSLQPRQSSKDSFGVRLPIWMRRENFQLGRTELQNSHLSNLVGVQEWEWTNIHHIYQQAILFTW